MSQKPETKFYSAIHRKIPKAVYRMKNNNPYLGGVPDCYYSGNIADMWIEYKWLPRVPKRGSVAPTKLLSDLQIDWLRGRHKEGRSVAVVIGCPTGGVVLDGLTWEKELSASEFVARVQSQAQLAEWITTRVQANTR